MNQNHANFQGRLDFIRNLLRERLGSDVGTASNLFWPKHLVLT
jgi:hypothetical protein